jgi:V/A-type H+-transporting ATPase subunit I
VPTVPVKNKWLAPFAMLVKQYGIPQYGEVDPTPLFAFTFLLMFGSMFGDVGQGAVIAGLAWYFRDKLGRFWLFGVMAGAVVGAVSASCTAASSATRRSCRRSGRARSTTRS